MHRANQISRESDLAALAGFARLGSFPGTTHTQPYSRTMPPRRRTRQPQPIWRSYEEPALGEQFPEEYKRYRANVRRWIPRANRGAGIIEPRCDGKNAGCVSSSSIAAAIAIPDPRDGQARRLQLRANQGCRMLHDLFGQGSLSPLRKADRP